MGIQQNLFTWIVLCKRNSLKPNVMFLQNIKKQESVENKKEGGEPFVGSWTVFQLFFSRVHFDNWDSTINSKPLLPNLNAIH